MSPRHRELFAFHLTAALAASFVGCTVNGVPDTTAGSGGSSTASGGASPGTGGAASGSGGSSSPGTGGVSSGSGGAATGTGGRATGSGGAATATGGRATGTGGATAATGGRGSGGTVGGTGGAATGSGGATTGAGGAGGTSAGCSLTTWPAGEQMYTLNVGGVDRTYVVGLPTGYSATKPNRVVFAFHGLGGTAQQIAGTGTRGYYGLRARMTDTIFISPQGLDDGGRGAGWPNTGGQDIAFIRAMVAWANTNYCVDQSRIYSTGFSYGGIISHTIGCQMSDVFRAIAPIAGAGFGGRGNTCLARPIPAWMAHGTMDSSSAGGVDFSAGQMARDRILATNHCMTTTTAVPPNPCVSYAGCDAGFPVHWCEHPAAHTIPSFAAEGIANFFLQF